MSTKMSPSHYVIGALLVLVAVLSISLVRRSGSPPDAVSAQRPNLRPAIQRAIETETRGLETEPQVDAYLDRLESRARSQNAVTAVEIEPGFAAIMRLQRTLGTERLLQKQAQFASRMERLQKELQSAKQK